MLLSCVELYNLKTKPKINELSLDLLREYYEVNLVPYIYTYTVYDKISNSHKVIKLKFEKENFCHLLGIESTVKRVLNKTKLEEYKGLPGWNNIKNSTITINTLKQLNKKGFNNNKARYIYFYLIPKIMDNPKAVLYDPLKVSEDNKVQCEILFYNKEQEAYIHIGIDKDEEKEHYYPRTFLIEKITEKNTGEKHIENQIKVQIDRVEEDQIIHTAAQ